MKVAFSAALVLAAVGLAGCRQQSHEGHHHPPSEHVRDQDQDQDLLPGRVKSAFAREFPDATIQDTEKQTHPDGAVHWEIRYRTKDGRSATAEFDTAGKLVSEQ